MRWMKGKTAYLNPGLTVMICWSCLCGLWMEAGAQGWPPQWEVLGRRVSVQQSRSASYRDHCVYQQKITLTRIETEKGNWQEKSTIIQRFTAETGPNVKGEVIMRVVSATDGGGKPMANGEKELGLLIRAAFWEELFYPFFPEKMKRLEILEIQETEENGSSMLNVHFATKENLKEAPSLEGQAHISPSSGELLRLELMNVQGFESMDKQATGFIISRLDVDYSSPEPGIRLPFMATLEGLSKSKPFKGSFRIRYQESAHTLIQDQPKN